MKALHCNMCWCTFGVADEDRYRLWTDADSIIAHIREKHPERSYQHMESTLRWAFTDESKFGAPPATIVTDAEVASLLKALRVEAADALHLQAADLIERLVRERKT